MAKVLVQSIPDYTYAQLLTADGRAIVADEPRGLGGDDLGPDPYALLLWSLGTCTAITLQMYASRKGIPLLEVAVEIEHGRKHAEDCESCIEGTKDYLGMTDLIHRRITVRGEDITEEQRLDLLRIAQRCPVHTLLMNVPTIVDSLDTVI